MVITAYNRSNLVRAAIESVLQQSIQPLEVIVVDHGSTDETPDVITSFGKSVHYVRLGASGRGGPAVPRNAGIHSSTGEWVAFLDDDDVWEPDKLCRQLRESERLEDALLLSTDAFVVDSDNQLLGPRYLSHTSAWSGDVFRELVKDNFVITSSVLVRHAALLEVGGFDERAALHRVEDYHLWLRLAARGNFAHVDEPLLRYRQDLSRFSKLSVQKALRDRRTVLRLALADEKVAAMGGIVRRGMTRDYARSALSLLR